jgi:hypothetical protein
MQTMEPIRVERTYTQKLHATPGEVFPLLCPVREMEWVAGWHPLAVYSRSGFAEPDCVFLTGEAGAESVWVITRHDPTNFHLEILKVTPWTTIARITVLLKPGESGGTDAEVTYSYMALDEAGKEFVENYTEGYYEEFMRYWESSLNAYLDSR